MILRALLLLAVTALPARAQRALEPSLLAAVEKLAVTRVGEIVSGWRDTIPVRSLRSSARGFMSKDSSVLVAALNAAFGPTDSTEVPAHWFAIKITLQHAAADSVEFTWREDVDSRCKDGEPWGSMTLTALRFVRSPNGAWSGPTRIRAGSPTLLTPCPVDRRPS